MRLRFAPMQVDESGTGKPGREVVAPRPDALEEAAPPLPRLGAVLRTDDSLVFHGLYSLHPGWVPGSHFAPAGSRIRDALVAYCRRKVTKCGRCTPRGISSLTLRTEETPE